MIFFFFFFKDVKLEQCERSGESKPEEIAFAFFCPLGQKENN